MAAGRRRVRPGCPYAHFQPLVATGREGPDSPGHRVHQGLGPGVPDWQSPSGQTSFRLKALGGCTSATIRIAMQQSKAGRSLTGAPALGLSAGMRSERCRKARAPRATNRRCAAAITRRGYAGWLVRCGRSPRAPGSGNQLTITARPGASLPTRTGAYRTPGSSSTRSDCPAPRTGGRNQERRAVSAPSSLAPGRAIPRRLRWRVPLSVFRRPVSEQRPWAWPCSCRPSRV